jgi:glycosyltransferase involved in cell wall biosynthesis
MLPPPSTSTQTLRTLVAIPVYNEASTVQGVLTRVLSMHPDVLVIDDGSTDATSPALLAHPVELLRHATNRGYGASIRDAFAFAIDRGYDWLITMDCDEQHEPAAIPRFMELAQETDADIISGSRYMVSQAGRAASTVGTVPADRRSINQTMTQEINQRLAGCLGTRLTDAFCGFKAHRVSSLRTLALTQTGYAFPMQLWAQAAAARLKVRELPVRLIYTDAHRSFGARLDDPAVRLQHYREVLHAELLAHAHQLPTEALEGLEVKVAGLQACARCGQPGNAGHAGDAGHYRRS